MSRIVTSLLLSGVLVAGPLLLWDAAVERAVERRIWDLSDPDLAVRARAEAWFVAAERALVPRLVAAFADEPEELRAASIVSVLTRVSPGRALPELVAGLGSEEAGVRHHCGIALAFLGEPALPALVGALDGAVRPVARVVAAWALAMMGPDAGAARSSLEAAATSTDKALALTARFALTQLDDTNADYWHRVREGRRVGLPLERPPTGVGPRASGR